MILYGVSFGLCSQVIAVERRPTICGSLKRLKLRPFYDSDPVRAPERWQKGLRRITNCCGPVNELSHHITSARTVAHNFLETRRERRTRVRITEKGCSY